MKKRKEKLRTQYLKTKAPRLDFDCSLQSNIFTIKQVINNLKTQRSKPEKASIRKYWVEDVLWKNSLLFTISNESCVFP